MNAAGLASLLSSADPAQLRQGLSLAYSLGEACPLPPLYLALAEAMLEASRPLGEGPPTSEVEPLVSAFRAEQEKGALPVGWAYRFSATEGEGMPRPRLIMERLDGERDGVLVLPPGCRATLRPRAWTMSIGSTVMVDGVSIDLGSLALGGLSLQEK